MKKLIFIFIIFLAACNASSRYAEIPTGSTVLILGDSLSYGTGANEGEDYPTLLAKTTGWKIINEGVPGDTTEGGLERLPELLDEYKPNLLIVELGGNDLLRQVPPSQVEENLKKILSLAKSQNVDSILVAIPEISPLMAAIGNLSDHPLYEKVAQETNTPLVKNVFSEVLSQHTLKSDPIHPNAQGYKQVAEMLNNELKEWGLVH